MKKTLLLCFYILSGIILGAMIAQLCAGMRGLSWLAYSQGVRLTPAMDLSVVRLTLDFYMGISVAQILTIGLAIFLYNRSHIR